MLCSFEPVKYCSAAPKISAGTTRRSTCSPPARRIDIFVSPRPITPADVGKRGRSDPSLRRRRTTRPENRDRRSCRGRGDSCRRLRVARRSGTFAASARDGLGDTCRPRPRYIRSPAVSASAMPARIASSVFAPKPLSSRTCCASQAARSSSSVVMFSSLYSTAAFFGPSPGMRSSASTLCGTWACSSSSIGSVPVVAQRGDLVGQVLADARRCRSACGRDRPAIARHRLGIVADRAGTIAIGPHAKRIRPLKLQQVGDRGRRRRRCGRYSCPLL